MLIDWKKVNRVLVIRLRSIGDTVLATPSLIALRRFLPDARIDVLLEDWVAPVLEKSDLIDNVLTLGKDAKSKLKTVRQIRKNKYDAVFNLHGGTTSTFFARLSGAKYRVGFSSYRYSFLYNHRFPSPVEFWNQKILHSAEQQLALLGFAGVPVKDRPKSRLNVTDEMAEEMDLFLHVHGIDEEKIALIHPAAAFDTKQWSSKNFAKIIDYLVSKKYFPVVVTTPKEEKIISEIAENTSALFHGFTGLNLQEITALASRAELFVGNDSGVAHIASAVGTPSVIIFGSSNRDHWRPWTNARHEIVFEELPCQPCAGYFCKEFAEPECIKGISVDSVKNSIEEVFRK